MQQPEEPGPEAETERLRGLGLVDEGCVVEPELLECFAEPFEVVAIGREQPGEDHRLGFLISHERLRRPIGGGRHGVPHLDLVDLLDTGDEVTHLPGAELGDLDGPGGQHADFVDRVFFLRGHEADEIPVAEFAVDDAHVTDDASIGVVVGIEYERTKRSIAVASGSGDLFDELLEQLVDAGSGLCRDPDDI